MIFPQKTSVLRTVSARQSSSICFTKILSGLIVGIVLLLTQPVFAAEVSIDTAENIAINLISYLGRNHTIHETQAIEQSNQKIGYLITLNPQGYILVAGDSIRVPIKAYSFTSSFDSLPPAYTQTLFNELQLPEKSAAKSTYAQTAAIDAPEETNRSYWEFLTLNTSVSKKSLQSYTPDTYLLTSQWNQSYPYNKFNPKLGDELTLTGCTQTALAQVMRYHAYPSSGSGVFNYLWNNQTLTAVMNRPFNWSAMPNSVNGSVEQYQQEEVAALMRDLGILNEANFGTGSTSASFHRDNFERAFGYGPISEMDSGNDDFFTTIRSEIDNLRPVLLMIPNHMTVADGYASDGSGKRIHVNMGWGGASDDYYYLDQTIFAGEYSFPPNHTIYYNIQPCRGTECRPYTPDSFGNYPVIASDLNDLIIDGGTILRIETYDPDGDTVTLSATSSSNSLEPSVTGNILTLTLRANTTGANNIFCEVTVRAQSKDGTAEKTFQILALEDMIYIGRQYDIGGAFADVGEVDAYSAYLDGYTTVAGNRGYSNQAFYIWIKDHDGNTVISASKAPISSYFTPGLYTIGASLTNPLGGSYYPYEADYSAYILTVTGNDLNTSVSDLAASMGIEFSDDTLPESIQSWLVLTKDSDPLTLSAGDYALVYGTTGTDTINMKTGARVQCLNFAGANQINIEETFSQFSISRSGATVYLTSTAGTLIKIAATTTPQFLQFADGRKELVITAGKVLLGDQIVVVDGN